MMSSMALAKDLILQEEESKRLDKLEGNIRKDIKKLEETTLKKVGAIEEELRGDVEEEVEEKHDIEYKQSEHWFQSGVTEITSATSLGTYPNVENLLNALGHAPESGWIQNFGPGLIFIVFSKSPAMESANELRLEPYAIFPFGRGGRDYQVNYMRIRTDTDGTEYKIVAY